MRSPYSFLLRKALLPVGDAVFGQRMIRRLRHLEEAQWWEPERLEVERRRRLRELLAVAYQEVPFYTDLFRKARIRPEDLTEPEHLHRLPVVTKSMLRDGYPSRTCRATGQRTYEACSSGSTGANFCVREDMETAGWYRASFLLALEWSGWNIGDPHMQTGMTLDRSRDRRWKDRLFRCRYVSSYDLSDANLDRALDAIERGKLRHLFGYPGSVYYLALRAASRGWNQGLRSVVTWGDMLHPQWRRQIEATFRTRVFDTYGCGEGFQIAAQCGEGTAYHVHALDVILEFVDEQGRGVAVGSPGDVLVTRLHPGPMPLIRYAVGDTAVRVAGRRCACGRGFQLMEGIEGRSGDVVVTPRGNRLIVHFFTGIMEYFSDVSTFRVVQEAADRIRIEVVPGKAFSQSTSDQIRTRLQEHGLEGMTIEVETVDSIPATRSGKRRFVVSLVPRGTPDGAEASTVAATS